MRKSDKAASSKGPSKERVVVVETDKFWFATDKRSKWGSGSLCYSKKSGQFRARVSELVILFPKLAKGKFSPLDSPLDQWKRPKVEFLFLFALRRMRMDDSPGCDSKPFFWARIAVDWSVAERERESGVKLAPEKLEQAERVASSFSLFEEYVLRRLFRDVVGNQGAGPLLRRYARWMDLIDQTIEEGIPVNYQRFLNAVEVAAARVKGVPTKMEVAKAFEDGLSANQVGQGHSCRSLRKQLRFEWLPTATRGPNRH